jgi:hypothetical protein
MSQQRLPDQRSTHGAGRLQHAPMRTSEIEGHEQIYNSRPALNPQFATGVAAILRCELRVSGAR